MVHTLGAPAPDFLTLLDKIYGAATDAARWPGMLEALSEALGGAAVGVVAGGEDILGPQPVLLGAGFREDLAEEYTEQPERWLPHNPFAVMAAARPGEFIDSRQFLSEQQVRKTYFYEDWMRPQGLLATGPIGSFWAPGADGPMGGTAFYPTSASGAFGRETARLAETLDRHIVRSARTLAMFEFARAERDAFLDALDGLERGVVLVDAKGRVIAANRSASEILNAGDGLTVTGGELTAAGSVEARHLRDGIVRAVRDRHVGRAFVLPRRTGARSYEIIVSPLRRRVSALRGALASAAVFIVDPEQRSQPAQDILMALYGLTPAEARLAAALGTGESTKAYARRTERSLETVRSLLKRVFAKTNTSRQAELTALVASGPGGLRTDAP